MIFVNVLETAKEINNPVRNSVYRIYGLYSGKSLEEIRINIITRLKEVWSFLGQVDDDLKFEDIPRSIEEMARILGAEEDDLHVAVDDYKLSISDPYTDIDETLDFLTKAYNDKYTHDGDSRYNIIIFYLGEDSERIGDVINYLRSITSEYKLSSNDIFNKRTLNILI